MRTVLVFFVLLCVTFLECQKITENIPDCALGSFPSLSAQAFVNTTGTGAHDIHQVLVDPTDQSVYMLASLLYSMLNFTTTVFVSNPSTESRVYFLAKFNSQGVAQWVHSFTIGVVVAKMALGNYGVYLIAKPHTVGYSACMGSIVANQIALQVIRKDSFCSMGIGLDISLNNDASQLFVDPVDDGIVIATEFFLSINVPPKVIVGGAKDIVIVKYHPINGTLLYNVQIGGTADETLQHVSMDKKGNVIVVASFMSNSIAPISLFLRGTNDYFISMINTTGHFVWSKSLSSTTSLSVNKFFAEADSFGNVMFAFRAFGSASSVYYLDTTSFTLDVSFPIFLLKNNTGSILSISSFPVTNILSVLKMILDGKDSLVLILSFSSGMHTFGDFTRNCGNPSCHGIVVSKPGNFSRWDSFITFTESTSVSIQIDRESRTFYISGVYQNPFTIDHAQYYPQQGQSDVFAFSFTQSTVASSVRVSGSGSETVATVPEIAFANSTAYMGVKYTSPILPSLQTRNPVAPNSQILIVKMVHQCTLCPPGTYGIKHSSQVTECYPCPSGTFATVIGGTNNSVCVPCPLGFNSTTGSSVCVPCPLGFYTPSVGTILCSLCPEGSYRNLTQGSSVTDCFDCPAGTFFNGLGSTTISYCLDCPKGYYSDARAVACIACPSGSFSSSLRSVSCTKCNPGRASNSIASATNTCLLCPPGEYSAEGSSTCQKCTPGTFNSKFGASSCNLCSPGNYSDILGAAICKSCQPGAYSAQFGATLCLPCNIGSYANISGATTCSLCNAAYFSSIPGSASCTACPFGSIAAQQGASSCSMCGPGTYAVQQSQKCEPCASGTFSPSIGAASNASCLLCPSGTFSSVQGAFSSVNCIPCAVGSYSTAGASSCSPCGLGTYTSSIGSSSCTQCMPGYFSNAVGATQCTACAIGSYNNRTASTSCNFCPAGTFASVTAATSSDVCQPCSLGTYSFISGSSSCNTCPIGSFASTIGSTSCTSCPSGTVSTLGSTSASSCASCSAGMYYSNSGGNPQCLACPIGSFSPNSGAQSIANCLSCPSGTYSSQVGASTCVACGAGYYSNSTGATSNSTCIACPSGTMSLNAIAAGSSSCVACPVGHYSLAASSSCIPCASGYYADSTNQATCLPCATGTFAATTGSASCSKCLTGHFSDVIAASSCKPCPIKTFNNKNGSISCEPCPPDAQCSLGASLPMNLTTANALTYDPYFNTIESTKAEQANQRNVINSVLLIVGFVMLCIFALCGVVLMIIASRKGLSPKVDKFLAQFDMFKIRHYSKMNEPIIKKGTYFGILCSVLFVTFGLIIMSVLLVDLTRNNVVDRKTIIPEQTLEAKMNRNINGTYTIILYLHNFVDGDCKPSQAPITGIVPNAVLSSAKYSNFTCKIMLQCVNCILDGSQQSVDLVWDSNFATASHMELFMFLPHYIPNQYFFIYESLVPPSENVVFKGKTPPTQITMSLTRTYHTLLVEDNFLNSFLARRPAGTTSSGYVAAKYPSRIGSTADAASYTSTTGLRVLITMNSDPNVFRIEQESLSSTLEWLSKLFALLSATFTLTSIAMRFLEKIKAMVDDKILSRKKQPNSDTPVTPATPASPNSNNDVMNSSHIELKPVNE